MSFAGFFKQTAGREISETTTILVDIWVIIDALANRTPFNQAAQELLIRGSEGNVSLLISAKSLLDIHYVLKHYLNDEAVVRTKLSDLLHAVLVVDTKGTSCATALSSPTTDYEDAVQIEAALVQGVDCIVTRDPSGYSHSVIKAMDPPSFSRSDGRRRDLLEWTPYL